MIKICFFPGRFLVALGALLAQTALVPVIIGMTGETITGRFPEFLSRRVTGIAGNAQTGMASDQWKIRRVMVERFFFKIDDGICPALVFRMASFALPFHGRS